MVIFFPCFVVHKALFDPVDRDGRVGVGDGELSAALHVEEARVDAGILLEPEGARPRLAGRRLEGDLRRNHS